MPHRRKSLHRDPWRARYCRMKRWCYCLLRGKAFPHTPGQRAPRPRCHTGGVYSCVLVSAGSGGGAAGSARAWRRVRLLQTQAECFGECRHFGFRNLPPAAIKDHHRQFAVAGFKPNFPVRKDGLPFLDYLQELPRHLRKGDHQCDRRGRGHRSTPLRAGVSHPMTCRTTRS
jgi:hypothetical protein